MNGSILGKYGFTSPAYMVKRIGLEALLASKPYVSGKLLDIGCGSREKERLYNGIEYVGLDHAGSPHAAAPDILGTADNIPVPDCYFDTVLCTAVLEHLEEPKLALQEAFRVLKAGGYAIYAVPLFWHLHEEPRDFYRYTKHGLKYLFEAVGFEIVEIIPLSGFWITFGSEWNYYIQRFAKGPLKYFVNGIVGFNNWLLPKLDHGILRDEKFTWMYQVIARKHE